MILPGQMIRMRGIFSPFSERRVHNGLSYGLSCAGYDVRLKYDVTLVQGYTIIGVTLEHMDFPPDLLGMVADKSTLARKGVQVQHTVIEPGWRGHLAVELTYQPTLTIGQAAGEVNDIKNSTADYKPRCMDIEAGTPIAQVLVHQLMAPAENTYKGKYQDQNPNDIEAKLEEACDERIPFGPSYIVTREEADRLRRQGWDVNWDITRQCWIATDDRGTK